MRKCFLIIVPLLFAFAFSAQMQAAAFDGLAVLFLVDQSGSMGGRAFGHNGAPTDPQGLRFQAVQYALQTLSEYHRVVPASMVFRMGVISFGDSTEVTLPWTATPDDSATLAPLLNQLSATAFGARNLGNTNFLAAFREAQRQFATLPSSEHHLRVIIVLTDGAPCAPAEFSDPSCASVSDQISHMNDLITLANSSFSADQYRLFAIAIDNRNEFWNRFESLWDQVVRTPDNATRVDNPTDVGQSFLQILAQVVNALRTENSLNGTNSSTSGVLSASQSEFFDTIIPVENGEAAIDVPPYYQSMRITVFKTQPVASIAISDPSGVTLSESSPHVRVTGVNGAIETWTISDPQPGHWHAVTTLDAHLIDIYLDLIPVNYSIDLPKGDLVRYVSSPVTLRIFDANGDPLPDYTDSRYQLNVQALLHAPNGITSQFTLSAQGQNTYTGEVLPDQEGSYTFDLKAVTTNVDGSPMTVIDAPKAATLDVKRVHLEATIAPQSDILISESVHLSAQILVGTSTTPLQNGDFAVDAIVHGGSSDNTFRLVPDANGTYSGDLAMENPGQFQITIQLKHPVPDGSDVVVDEATLPLFRVNPADFIGLRIVQPQDKETQYTTIGFPPLQPNDLVIDVLATGANGSPQAIEALTPEGTIPLHLSVRDDQNTELAGSVSFVVAAPGEYRAVIPHANTGTFTIAVNADTSVKLGASTLFDPRFAHQTLTITRTTNPALIVTLAAIFILVVALVTGLVLWILRQSRLRQHPATGRLVLLSEDFSQGGFDRSQIWSYSLDRERKNYIVIKRVPIGLKRIVVECTSDAMTRQKQVLITVEFGGKKIVNRQPFRPNTERRLDALSTDNIAYTLAKDPELLDE